jgi:alpha-beta hydrolase superfamily lysophospholipase
MASNVLPTDDGHLLELHNWLPGAGGSPRAVVQLLHGLGEHAGRYQRFAKACNAESFAVIAHNHRGHGPAADCRGHFADANGWNRVIADVAAVNTAIRLQYPDLPVVLFGHSMGSYIAQSYAMRHPADIDLLVLSGSTFGSRPALRVGHLLAGLLALFGKRRRSALLDYLGIGAFNRKFRPNRTDNDWLSRDEAEVDRFCADPACGGPYTNRLWFDLTGGLLEITSRTAVSKIPRDLPVLILGGEKDPVGGKQGLARLADVYRATGHADLTVKVYPGGRHEMLNETNRDEVAADILYWMRSRLS